MIKYIAEFNLRDIEVPFSSAQTLTKLKEKEGKLSRRRGICSAHNSHLGMFYFKSC